MNRNVYSTNMNIYELYDFIYDHKIIITVIEMKDKIYFRSSYKYHHILSENKNINYLYTTHLIGMIYRFFVIEKIVPFILSFIILFTLSNIIFEFEILGESIEHKNEIIYLLNADSKFILTNRDIVIEKLNKIKDRLVWFEVKQKGSKLTITYLPKIETINNENNIYEIIAQKDAIIASFDVLSGNKLVKVNQKVKKGDVLINHFDFEKNNQLIGKVYGYTFKKVDLTYKKNSLPISLQKYILLLKARMNIDLDENERIVKEFSLQFSEERDTIRIINFYVLYEMISMVGDIDE